MLSQRTPEKADQSHKIASDVDRFLEDGGEITQASKEDNKFYRDWVAKSGCADRTPFVINTHKGAINAHQWRTGHPR